MNCGKRVISPLMIPYFSSTSPNSFLVLYEENDLSFFSLHSLANFASVFAGPPVISHLSSSSWVKSRNARPFIFCLRIIFHRPRQDTKSCPCKYSISLAVLYFLISSASETVSFPATVLVSDIALRFYRDIWLGQKIVLRSGVR
jgi:hypothetical protein